MAVLGLHKLFLYSETTGVGFAGVTVPGIITYILYGIVLVVGDGSVYSSIRARPGDRVPILVDITWELWQLCTVFRCEKRHFMVNFSVYERLTRAL